MWPGGKQLTGAALGRLMVLVACWAVLACASPAIAAPGCCVCKDGRCLEDETEMLSCIRACAAAGTEGQNFNSGQSCLSGACATASTDAKNKAKPGAGK